MSNPDEEVLKEKNIDSSPQPGRGGWRGFGLYMLRSITVGCLLFLLVSFAIVSSTSSPGFQTTPTQELIIVVFLLFAGAAWGPYSGGVVNSDYVFLQFFGLPLLLIVFIAAGHRYREAWWGKVLGIAGVCLWLLVGSRLLY